MLRQLPPGGGIDRVADLLGAGSSGGDAEAVGQSGLLRQVLHDELGHGAAADVAVTDEEDAEDPAVGGLPLFPGLLDPHAAVDGSPQAVEFLLVVSHDAPDTVGVEIPGDLLQLVARLGKLEEGPLKETAVVGLEMDLPAVGQNAPVALQKVRVGEAAPGVTVGGPGVAEVDIDALHLAGGEVVPQVGHVGVDEADVLEAHGLGPLHGDDHGVGHPLDGDEEDLRLGGGGLTGEAALAAAQLHPQLAAGGQELPPAAPPALGVLDLIVGTTLHPGDEVGFLTHTHGGHAS